MQDFECRAEMTIQTDSNARIDWRRALCGLPAIALLVMFLIVPLAELVYLSWSGASPATGSGTPRLERLPLLVEDRFIWEVFGFTLVLAAVLTTVCLALGYGLALFLWRLRGGWKAAAVVAVLVPKLSNILITAYGLKLLLGEAAPVNRLLAHVSLVGAPLPLLNNRVGVLISETYFILPYTVLILWMALEQLDGEVLVAARGLGATPLHVLRRVILPLSRPGLAVAGTITAVWGLGAYVGPILFGSPQELTLAVDIQRQAFENQDWARAAVEALLLLITLAGLAVLSEVNRRRSEKNPLAAEGRP
jgi:ABC-type spermidine/putrescine transport system permease subunit I